METTESHNLCGSLHFHIDRAQQLPNTDIDSFPFTAGNLTDPFVVVEIEHIFGTTELFRTDALDDTLEPIWSDHRTVDISFCTKRIVFQVRDKESIGSEAVASVSIAASELVNGEEIDDWFDLEDEDNTKCGQLKIEVQYVPNA